MAECEAQDEGVVVESCTIRQTAMPKQVMVSDTAEKE